MHPLPAFLSDLCLLRDLFAPDTKQLLVCDPHQRLTSINGRAVTYTDNPIREPRPETFFVNLASGQTERQSEPVLFIGTHDGACAQHFYFINNPDGTIRWIFDSDEHSSAFLSLYNTGTMKGRLYRTITQFAWSIGQGHRLVSGLLLVQKELVDDFRKRMGIEHAERISIFTGTRGLTRKVVVGIHEGTETKDFIKVPMSEEAKHSIQNENDMIISLNKYDFTTLSLPRLSKKIQGTTRLSNIRPSVTIPMDRINAIHVQAVAELYSLSHDQKKIGETSAWQTIVSNMEWMKRELQFTNGLDEATTRQLMHHLRKLYNSIDPETKVPVSVSHGDFTPWNMYCDEQRLYVYDWELAKNGIPMLFDLFHFTFQSVILQQRKSYKQVKENISRWQAMPTAGNIIHKYAIQPQLHFRLYLLFTVSYYLRQYIAEKELLEQTDWMMQAWLEAFEEIAHSTENPTSKL